MIRHAPRSIGLSAIRLPSFDRRCLVGASLLEADGSARWMGAALIGLSLVACSTPEPRFAEVSVSASAPSATLSGSTRGVAPAIELSPGCPGYLDPDAPEHVVHLADATAITLTARSNRGPLALAIAGEGEVRCDSDAGSGHAPHVTIAAPGDYVVHVASLNEAAELPYELTITPTGHEAPGLVRTPAGDRVAVSVTITSEPSGATVRTPEGEVLGTTPAMFALQLGPAEIGQERRFLLEMAGRQASEVRGRMIGGAVVLHASLQPGWGVSGPVPGHPAPAAGPELVVSAASAQPIRDYEVARQSLEVGSECTIERASVDVDIRHSFIGDLRVVLRSPHGTQVTLHNHGGGGRANLVTSWNWDARRGALQTLAGQPARGRWEMAVHDDAGADTGTFRSFTLHFACREGTVASATSSPAPIPGATAATGIGALAPSAPGPGIAGGASAAPVPPIASAPRRDARPRVRRLRSPPSPAQVPDPWSSHLPTIPPQAAAPQGRRNAPPPGGGVVTRPF